MRGRSKHSHAIVALHNGEMPVRSNDLHAMVALYNREMNEEEAIRGGELLTAKGSIGSTGPTVLLMLLLNQPCGRVTILKPLIALLSCVLLLN